MELDKKLSARLASIYYSPRGYWKGLAAIKNLPAAAKISDDLARAWLRKQAFGRSTSLAHGTYHGQSLTWQCQTKYTKRICSFCHTTA